MKRRSSASRKNFIFYDRDSWSTDSDDEDYINSQKTRKTSVTDKSARVARRNICEKKTPSAKGCLNCWGECIPVEILYIIFKYVFTSDDLISAQNSISKVCRLWRSVSLIPLLWTNVDLSKVKSKKEKTFTDFFQDERTSLAAINLNGWSHLKPSSFELMMKNCPNLRSINLTGTKVTGESLMSMVTRCPLLDSITLSNMKSTAVSQGFLVQLVRGMNVRLRSFSFTQCQVNGFVTIFNMLMEHCPNMESFEMGGISSKRIIQLCLEQLQTSWQNLRSLRLSDGYYDCFEEPIGPGFLELRELSLCNVENNLGSNDFISNLLAQSSKLELLHLRNIYPLNLPMAAKLKAKGVSHLYLNKMDGCPVRMGAMLTKWKDSLIDLDLSDIFWLEEEFYTLMEVFEAHSFPLLKTFSLRASPVCSKHVLCIINSCPNLSELNLTQCRSLPRGTKRLHFSKTFNDLVSTLKKAAL